MNNRYCVRRVDAKPSPYVNDALRAKYAVECFTAITSHPDQQILTLELLWLGY